MDNEICEARVGSAEAVRQLTRNAPATRHGLGFGPVLTMGVDALA
jgi:hypothetical protein